MPTVKIPRSVAEEAARHASKLNDAYNADIWAMERVVDLEILVQQRKKYMPKVKPRKLVAEELAGAREASMNAGTRLNKAIEAYRIFEAGHPNVHRIKAWEAVYSTRWPHYKVWPGYEADPLIYVIEG